MWRLLAGISLTALAAEGVLAQNNSAVFDQTGSNLTANVDNDVAGNSRNASIIIQNGTFLDAIVFQRGADNRSFIQQVGSFQTATHQQVGTFNNADTRQLGDFQIMATSQVGNSNAGNLVQVGTHNRSIVRQGYAVDSTVPEGEQRAADFNTANIDQEGAGLNSVIDQRAASANGVRASNNQAIVFQRSSGSSSSIQQTSTITQESAGNFARVSQFDGSTAVANSSAVTQRNSASPALTSANSATIEQRGIGQTSQVTQDGSNNQSGVTMSGGGAGTGDGNSSTISQQGSGLSASLTFIERNSIRRGNSSEIVQTGTNHSSTVYQSGLGDQSRITQANGVNSSGYPTGAVPSARALVSQNANGASAALNQQGDNYGEIVQAFGTGSSASMTQVDAGDNGSVRAANSAIISQYGNGNSVTAQQNAVSATATLWQQVGSSANVMTLGQGTGGTTGIETAGVPNFAAGPTGANAQILNANIIQGGAGNRATVYQDGLSLQADVRQYGSATQATPNRVFVSQTGSNNSARAEQSANVGPSAAGAPASGNAGDEFFFGGGTRSAEIAILQTSGNNSATVEQFGRGQYARVEQSGGGSNTAGIRQESGADNATAVIRQTGTDNSYFIVQTTPGQYIVVTQTGIGNSAANTNVIQRGGAGGSNGFTPPPGG